jgi:perosamine synthetase
MFENVINFIQDTYKTKEFIPLHEPRFIGNEKKYLNECIDLTFVSSVGRFVDEFKEKIAKYAIAASNEASALHILLLLADVDQNSEVITRPIWILMNKLPMFEHAQCGDLINAGWLEERAVNMPSSVLI